jgi:putative DNA primase/helicase
VGTFQRHYAELSSDRLGVSDKHAEEILGGSGISPRIVVERGYRTLAGADGRAVLRDLGFSPSLAPLPGVLVPVRWAGGEVVGHQFKPDRPRSTKGKAVKYENPTGQQIHLDVAPSMWPALSDSGARIWITEGVKKVDALASHGEACVGLVGVWGWCNKGRQPLAEWADVKLDGKEALIAFDSDAMTKDSVAEAREALTAFLRSRGATVRWIYLPEEEDVLGQPIKVGVDDYLVEGHDVDEVLRLARDPLFSDRSLPTWDDFGNAQRLVDRYADRLRWAPANGHWAVYDSRTGLWEPRGADDRAAGLARKTVERMESEEAPFYSAEPGSGRTEKTSRRDDWLKFVAGCRKTSAVQAMLAQARTKKPLQVSVNDLDADPNLVHCTNGVLDLSSLALLPHSPEHYCTLTTGTHYDSQADDPMWSEYLDTFVPDQELRDYVQLLLGYSLLDGNPERLFVIVQGGTSTGKSTFNEAVLGALGGYSDTFNLSLFRANQDEKARPDIASALTKRFLSTTEASQQWRLHADQIKKAVGGDTLRARYPYDREYVHRVPAFTPWLFTNDVPTIEGRDLALDRRVVVLPFHHEVSGRRDKRLARQKMTSSAASRAAVLAWAVRGLERYKVNGLGTPPEQVTAATQDARSEFSDLDLFLSECCTFGPEERVRPEDLYDKYADWCLRRSIADNDRLSGTRFGRAIKARGYERKRLREGGLLLWWYVGLSVPERLAAVQ